MAPRPKRKKPAPPLHAGGITYQHRMTRCGKQGCARCESGGHGPYWYAFWKSNGRTVCKYVGRELPPALAGEKVGADAPKPKAARGGSPSAKPRKAAAAKPAPRGLPLPRSTPATLPEFLSAVRAAAVNVPEVDRMGRRVFLYALRERLGMDLPTFRRWIVAAQREDRVRLDRLDLRSHLSESQAARIAGDAIHHPLTGYEYNLLELES